MREASIILKTQQFTTLFLQILSYLKTQLSLSIIVFLTSYILKGTNKKAPNQECFKTEKECF